MMLTMISTIRLFRHHFVKVASFFSRAGGNLGSNPMDSRTRPRVMSERPSWFAVARLRTPNSGVVVVFHMPTIGVAGPPCIGRASGLAMRSEAGSLQTVAPTSLR